MDFAVRSFEELSKRELHDLLRLRSDVFVVEQQSPYPDLDGLDPVATHLLGTEQGHLMAYARWFRDDFGVWLGRIVLAPEVRGAGHGRALIERALAAIGPVEVSIRAQCALGPYYRSLGWEDDGAVYDDHGVDHIVMRRQPVAASLGG